LEEEGLERGWDRLGLVGIGYRINSNSVNNFLSILCQKHDACL